jgi:hypothetical protein
LEKNLVKFLMEEEGGLGHLDGGAKYMCVIHEGGNAGIEFEVCFEKDGVKGKTEEQRAQGVSLADSLGGGDSCGGCLVTRRDPEGGGCCIGPHKDRKELGSPLQNALIDG